jgi:hypothetical protein
MRVSPEQARVYIEGVYRRYNLPYGTDVTLPWDIDTSPCRWFFGLRCPYNVHVTGRRRAHIDRFDPRYNLKEHLDHDVWIPHELVTIGVPVGVGVLAGHWLGRARGAVIGAIAGLVVGWLVELST